MAHCYHHALSSAKIWGDTCSNMRPDGFGGMAVLITPDAIKRKSTSDILEELFAEIDQAAPARPA